MAATAVPLARATSVPSVAPVKASSVVPVKAIGNVLVVCALAIVAFAGFVLIGLGGWTYYTTPTAVRGYTAAHRLLRPSGAAGHLFGIGGFLMMLVPVAYSIRKKVRWLRNAGSMKRWLDFHVFAGVFGPVLVTFHTSFKFNGIVSVAYWSMIAVVLSGFVGRYLYNRIPRSIRGQELTQAELDARASELSRQISDTALPDGFLTDIEAFEHRVLPAQGRPPSFMALWWGEFLMHREIARLSRRAGPRGLAPELHQDAIDLIVERATLGRRIAYLKKTKTLFDVWHVFHMPLVYIMFAIVLMHVAVTMYMGYVPFRY
jgi:hypothetical protein